MSTADFGAWMAAWAAREPAVSGLVLIGSRERAAADRIWRADAQSDWDFQIITSRPQRFARRDWLDAVTGGKVRAYAARPARIGGVPKVSAVLAETEADFVIIPTPALTQVRRILAQVGHRRDGAPRRMLQDLAIVIRPGWRFLKGERTWGSVYRRVVAEVGDPRIDDAAAGRLAEAFVCDYVWVRRRLARGEYRAAQRHLHRELAEANFRLLHELRLRRNERSFPEARRIECIAGVAALQAVTIDARLEPRALRAAADKSATTCRRLMRALVGDSWRWPEAGSSGR